MNYPPTKTTPWKHQVDAWEQAKNFKSYYYAHDMGAGKSKAAVDYCNGFNSKYVLIICPKKVINVWPKQYNLHSATPYRVLPLKKGNAESKAREVLQFLKDCDRVNLPGVVITNYDTFWRPPLGPSYDGNKIVNKGILAQIPWSLVVADEAHRIKSPNGRASWGLARIAPVAERRLFLSGTPMPHALGATEPVLTPTGWKPIGQLAIGDQVIGSNGKPTNVIGVWPQGIQQLYTIKFSDGADVVCTGDHLWQVTSRGRTSRRLPPFIKRTDELADPLPLPKSNAKPRPGGKKNLMDTYDAARWNIPICSAVEMQTQPVPLDPYLMGAILGDGHLGRPISFVTADPQIAEEISRALPHPIKLVKHEGGSHGRAIDYRISSGKKGGSTKGYPRGPIKNPVTVALEKLGLRNHNSQDKFIPDCYLWNSIENRLAILQGLCDTDGTTYGSTSRFVTTSPRLADGVKFLIRSLGGHLSETIEPEREVTLPNGTKTIGRPKHIILFRSPVNPFRLKRKREKYIVSPRIPRRGIRKIEPIGKGEAVCITVNAPDGLYVTKDFIVTHNSPLDIYAQFRALDPTVFGKSFALFRRKYCQMGGFENRQVVAFINQDDLQKRFYSRAHRVEVSDVLDLPEETDIILECDLDPKTMRIYKEVEEDFFAEVEGGVITVKTALDKLLRLAQLTAGILSYKDLELDEQKIQIVDQSKVDTAIELIQDIPLSEPVVIFYRFKPEAVMLKQRLTEIGRTPCEISGTMDEQLKFENGHADTAVVQIQAGCEGLDNLKRARYCVYLSLTFSLGQYKQSRARIHRPGQLRHCFYYHIIAKRTVDKKIMKALAAKEEVVNYVLRKIKKQKIQEAA